MYSPSRIVKLEELGLDSEIVRLESQIVEEREREREAKRKAAFIKHEEMVKKKKQRMAQIKKQ